MSEIESNVGVEGRDQAELIARIESLEAELSDLRSRYHRVGRPRYRRTAIVLALLGLTSLGGAWALPEMSEVLIALGGIGLFGALLLYYLTPERFIAATIGEQVYEVLATNQAVIVAEQGLQGVRVYLPASTTPSEAALPTVRLFVPKQVEYELPPPEALEHRFVATGNTAEHGMTFVPTATGLIAEFEATLGTGVDDSPIRLANQLVDGLEHSFELVDGVTPKVSPGEGRAQFAVRGSAFGRGDRFDHPVQSFLAVGLAGGLKTPVTASVSVPGDDDPADYLVTCEWTPGSEFLPGDEAKVRTIRDGDP